MKKNIYHIMCMASVLALTAACQDDDLATKDGSNALTFSVSLATDPQSGAKTRTAVEFTDDNGNPTPFDITLSVEDTYAEEMVTRGTPIKDADSFMSTVKEFKAWGWYNTTAWPDIVGAKIKQYAGMDYRPVDGEDKFVNAFKPSNTNLGYYHFYAHYPYDLSETGASITTGPTYNNGYTITYTSPGGTGGSTDAELQKEVLAGYMKSTTNTAVVPMTFKPILAAIQFKVSDKFEHPITINSIELQNFYYSGSCVVKSNGTPEVKWTTTTSSKRTFKQDFNQAISESDKGNYINDDVLSKTFFVVPQTCSSEMKDGEKLGAMIHINYSEEIDGVVHNDLNATHLVFGTTYEAGKTYVYKIGKFDDEPENLQPWVDFSAFYVNEDKLLGTNNTIKEQNHDSFNFNFAQQGDVSEKAYFPVYNLEPDHWYSIEFTERATLYNRDNATNNNSTGVLATGNIFSYLGCYACTVCSESETVMTKNNASQIIYDRFLGQNTFIWEHPDDVYGSSAYNSLMSQGKTAKVVFKATSKTMIWEWEFSSGRDTYILNSEIYLVGSKIRDITPVDGVPTVDFLGATLYNFKNNNADWNSHSSMKTEAFDATLGAAPEPINLYFRVTNNGSNWGRVNIPLINLDPEKTYRITYTLQKAGTTAGRNDADYSLGYTLQETENTSTGKMLGTTNYKSFKGEYKTANFNFTKSFDFQPTAQTMYWIWDFSELNIGTDTKFLTFSNVTIEEVTE